jgi:ArsR family transcriptional regulator
MPRRSPLESAVPVAGALNTNERVANLEVVFKALADRRRLIMLNAFAKERFLSVSDLSGPLGLSQSRASYHVKQLVDAGLITGERTGNFIWYSLADGAFERLAALFTEE